MIRREFRTVSYGDGLVCNNVMYVELKPDILYQLTFPEEIPAMKGTNNSCADVSDNKKRGSLPTKSDSPMEILGERGTQKENRYLQIWKLVMTKWTIPSYEAGYRSIQKRRYISIYFCIYF